MMLTVPERPAVLVPVKAFAGAKVRLSEVLDPSARETLARTMATRVLAAAEPLPCHVVCDDPDVAIWALDAGATPILVEPAGLTAAVVDGVNWLAGAGYDHVVVAHGDLPLATDLAPLADFGGVSIVPDRHRDGTPVLAVPTALSFEFSYGPGSFRRHIAAAEASGVGLRIVPSPELGWDVDVPADLEMPHDPVRDGADGRIPRGST